MQEIEAVQKHYEELHITPSTAFMSAVEDYEAFEAGKPVCPEIRAIINKVQSRITTEEAEISAFMNNTRHEIEKQNLLDQKNEERSREYNKLYTNIDTVGREEAITDDTAVNALSQYYQIEFNWSITSAERMARDVWDSYKLGKPVNGCQINQRELDTVIIKNFKNKIPDVDVPVEIGTRTSKPVFFGPDDLPDLPRRQKFKTQV